VNALEAQIAEKEQRSGSIIGNSVVSQEIGEKIDCAVYGVLEDDDGIGTAFFFQPRRALTVKHNIPDCVVGSIATLISYQGEKTKVKVVNCGDGLDYAVLEPVDLTFHSQFLEIAPIPKTARYDMYGVVTFHIGMDKQTKDLGLGVGVVYNFAKVQIVKNHHLTYSSATFEGDSGGAIVLRDNGKVIAMHTETVNQARELKRQKEVEERLDDIEESVQSLINCTSSGCIALRLENLPLFDEK